MDHYNIQQRVIRISRLDGHAHSLHIRNFFYTFQHDLIDWTRDYDNYLGHPLPVGYVLMRSQEDAQRAIRELHAQQLCGKSVGLSIAGGKCPAGMSFPSICLCTFSNRSGNPVVTANERGFINAPGRRIGKEAPSTIYRTNPIACPGNRPVYQHHQKRHANRAPLRQPYHHVPHSRNTTSSPEPIPHLPLPPFLHPPSNIQPINLPSSGSLPKHSPTNPVVAWTHIPPGNFSSSHITSQTPPESLSAASRRSTSISASQDTWTGGLRRNPIPWRDVESHDSSTSGFPADSIPSSDSPACRVIWQTDFEHDQNTGTDPWNRTTFHANATGPSKSQRPVPGNGVPSLDGLNSFSRKPCPNTEECWFNYDKSDKNTWNWGADQHRLRDCGPIGG
ncbi:hypothetical protein K504DRAFT_488105 [Pleomassaria siparia CBS 279.74]|uniref:RRM domain-containing protein n=1 Tax=Pleomassaria siparia CBS 279.74 TaxID=1314801 RepID=A0A6G1KMC4_9PLEO|nr:hypothetical protein K504DRAFT_488105 [Pleomassaria siparia CBS 279.74]